jgi:hypothetical protein
VLKLEQIQKNATITGLELGQVVRIVTTEPLGDLSDFFLRSAELPRDLSSESDSRLPVLEALHHLIRGLNQDGESAAGALLARSPRAPTTNSPPHGTPSSRPQGRRVLSGRTVSWKSDSMTNEISLKLLTVIGNELKLLWWQMEAWQELFDIEQEKRRALLQVTAPGFLPSCRPRWPRAFS